MEERKRSRGRPKGSGIDDRETLMKIASIIASRPETKRTTAIKKAGVTNPSVIRRLRDKFNEQADDLIASVKNGSGAKSAKSAKPAAKPKPAKATGTAAKSNANAAKPASRPAAKKAAPAKAAASKAEPKKATPKKATAPKATEPKKAAASKAAPKKATPKKATTRHTGPTAKATSAPKATNGKAGQPHLSSDLSKAGLMMADPNWMNTGVESVVSGLVEQQIQLYESALKHSPMATFLRQQAMMIDMTLSMLKAQETWSGKSK